MQKLTLILNVAFSDESGSEYKLVAEDDVKSIAGNGGNYYVPSADGFVANYTLQISTWCLDGWRRQHS